MRLRPGARPGSRATVLTAASWPRRRLAAVRRRVRGGTSAGSAPPSRTLTSAPGQRGASRRGLADLRARLRPQRRGGRGGSAGPAGGELAGAPGRRRLRPAAAGRRPGDRGHRERLDLRARPGHRQGRLADARRHPGAAGRACRAATSTRSASPAPPSTTRPTGWSTPWRRPPATTTCWSASRSATAPPGRARYPDPGRAAAVRPAAARAQHPGRAGVRGVRRAVRRLRAVPRLGGGHPARRERAGDLLRGSHGT